VVVCTSEPEVPVIVNVLVPTAAVLAAANWIVLLYVVGFVAKIAVTPFGRPEIDKLTLALNPFCVWR
jgi:hypothetical protein